MAGSHEVQDHSGEGAMLASNREGAQGPEIRYKPLVSGSDVRMIKLPGFAEPLRVIDIVGSDPPMRRKIGSTMPSSSGGKIEPRKKQKRDVNEEGIEGQTLVEIPTKSCLGTAKGWEDTPEKFVRTPSDFKRENYFRSYGESCFYGPKWAITPDSILEKELFGLEYANRGSDFDESYAEEIRYAFQIPYDYEIRVARGGETIYHRDGGSWVGIPLEHFRAGLRLPMHRFFYTLMVDMRLGLGQIGPNSVRKICAFIARCTELRFEPTLSLFWSLHKVQASRDYVPLFEIHWRGAKALGGILTDFPGTNKGWHREFVKIKGGDLGYLPEYRMPKLESGTEKRVEHLSGNEMNEAIKFVGGASNGYYTVSNFYDPEFLYDHNLLLEKLEIPNTMDKNRILALAQKKKLREKEASFPAKCEDIDEGSMEVLGVEIIGESTNPDFKKTEDLTEKTGSIAARVKRLRNLFQLTKKEKGGEAKRGRSSISLADLCPTESGEERSHGVSLPPISGIHSSTEREGQTFLKFGVNQGWLADPGQPVPLGALEAFALAPDVAKLGVIVDAEIIAEAGRALGVLGTYYMEVLCRARQRGEELTAELRGKEKIEEIIKNLKTQGQRAIQDLKLEERKSKELEGKLAEAQENINSLKRKANDSQAEESQIRAKSNNMEKELEKMKVKLTTTEQTLEKMEQETEITYKHVVETFKASREFKDILEDQTGGFHEIGYNDCLNFVGKGNIVDPAKHSVTVYRQHVLEKGFLEGASSTGQK